MITTKFEDTYTCVNNAKNITADLLTLADLLMQANRPMTCREIGIALFGDKYIDKSDYYTTSRARRMTAHLSQMLRHFRKGGFIKVEEIKGEPFEVTNEEYVRKNDKDNPQFIRVHDDAGNEYQMPNPNYNPWKAAQAGGSWQMVKKIVTPTYKVYSWAVE